MSLSPADLLFPPSESLRGSLQTLSSNVLIQFFLPNPSHMQQNHAGHLYGKNCKGI